jgi:hypothetical protein
VAEGRTIVRRFARRFAGGFVSAFARGFAPKGCRNGANPHRRGDRGAPDFPTSPCHLGVAI